MLTKISNRIRQVRKKEERSNDIFFVKFEMFEVRDKKEEEEEVGTEIKSDEKIMRQMNYIKKKFWNQQTVDDVCAGTSGVCISKTNN